MTLIEVNIIQKFYVFYYQNQGLLKVSDIDNYIILRMFLFCMKSY
jgi:hypothetical protein